MGRGARRPRRPRRRRGAGVERRSGVAALRRGASRRYRPGFAPTHPSPRPVHSPCAALPARVGHCGCRLLQEEPSLLAKGFWAGVAVLLLAVCRRSSRCGSARWRRGKAPSRFASTPLAAVGPTPTSPRPANSPGRMAAFPSPVPLCYAVPVPLERAAVVDTPVAPHFAVSAAPWLGQVRPSRSRGASPDYTAASCVSFRRVCSRPGLVGRSALVRAPRRVLDGRLLLLVRWSSTYTLAGCGARSTHPVLPTLNEGPCHPPIAAKLAWARARDLQWHPLA